MEWGARQFFVPKNVLQCSLTFFNNQHMREQSRIADIYMDQIICHVQPRGARNIFVKSIEELDSIERKIDALHAALLGCDIGPGDSYLKGLVPQDLEAILPAYFEIRKAHRAVLKALVPNILQTIDRNLKAE